MATQYLTGFDYYSDQLTNARALERSFLSQAESRGRVRSMSYSFNTGAGLTEPKDIALCVVPANSRIISIYANWEAMGSSADMDLGWQSIIGVAIGAVDSIVANADVASAGSATYYLISTAAGQVSYETGSSPEVLTAGADTANWAADKDLKGYVFFTEGA